MDCQGLIQDWNNDPPPTPRFLEAWLAFEKAPVTSRLDEFSAMRSAVTTPQDLAQFLLILSEHPHSRHFENEETTYFLNALAGVIVQEEKGHQTTGNPWRDWAERLDGAMDYE